MQGDVENIAQKSSRELTVLLEQVAVGEERFNEGTRLYGSLERPLELNTVAATVLALEVL